MNIDTLSHFNPSLLFFFIVSCSETPVLLSILVKIIKKPYKGFVFFFCLTVGKEFLYHDCHFHSVYRLWKNVEDGGDGNMSSSTVCVWFKCFTPITLDHPPH